MATIRSSSSSNGDIDSAAAVANWLPQGLQSVLPDGVQADFQRLALAGHSKGGHTAFALATKKYAKTTLDFSVLLGIDPVAGFQVFNHKVPISPSILTYKPNSLGINIPVLVVGTGLGDKGKLRVIPPCAPSRLNHAEFFNECKPPCNYFVAKDYGHMDMLDDDAPEVALIACKCGKGCRRKVRRSIAGLAIAFLEAFLDGNKGDLAAVVADPSVAPAALDPVEEKQVSRLAVLSRL